MNRQVFWIAMLTLTTAAVAFADPAIPHPADHAATAFRMATDTVMPSVVTIETYGTSTMPVTKQQKRAISGFASPGEGPTTGLVYSADGYILTSTYNFIRKPKIITVVLSNGTRKIAKLLGKDETRQLALLKIDEVDDLSVPQWAPRDQLRVGQWAITVGLGYGGNEPALSVGMIGATERISGKAVQTDANISPANYGGPLLDIAGRVIGLCTPLAPGSGELMAGAQWYDSGIGFAVPIDGLEPIIERLKKGETIQRGMVGVVFAEVGNLGGVKVNAIAKDSPAEKVGLKKDDVLKSINGRAVVDLSAMKVEIGRYPAGEDIVLGLERDGKPFDAKITLATGPFKNLSERPRPSIRERVFPNRPKQ